MHLTLLLAAIMSFAQPAPSLDRPCSFVSAAEMTTLLGATVSAATDEKFRCKYTVGSGWLETKLMDFSLKMTKDILEYNKARGAAVPGIGDQAYVLGATLAVRLGDLIIVVDGANLTRPPSNATLKGIAQKIIRLIP